MADDALLGVLQALGDRGAVLKKGTVTAVSTGALTVKVDGDVFTPVSYLKGSWVPAVNDICYMLLQTGFGALVIGSPVAPAADPAPTPPTTATITPSTLGNWQLSTAYPAGHWVLDGTGALVQTKEYASSGAWFYAAGAFSGFTHPLAQIQLQLEVDTGTVQLALHRNATPAAALDSYAGPLTVSVTPGVATWVNLPLQWGRDLISGAAKGIVARSQLFDAHLTGDGTIKLTSL